VRAQVRERLRAPPRHRRSSALRFLASG
jgi:hypothetical protein